MPESTLIQVRIDAKTKARATKLFKRLGLSTSDAVRLFLTQAIEEKGLPFQPHIPNAETRKALRDENLREISLSDLSKMILGDK